VHRVVDGPGIAASTRLGNGLDRPASADRSTTTPSRRLAGTRIEETPIGG
jgi:hypothetical protein